MLVRKPHYPTDHSKSRHFWPHVIAVSIRDVNFKHLQSMGVKALLIDLDDTVVQRGTFEVDPAVTSLLANLSLPIYIATNRPKSRDLKNLKEHLHATGVVHPNGVFGKPSKQYFRSAVAATGYEPREVAMIGDRLLQDIFGANRAGLRTVAVAKLGKPENPFDLVLSVQEARFLKTIALEGYESIK